MGAAPMGMVSMYLDPGADTHPIHLETGARLPQKTVAADDNQLLL